MTQNNLFFVKVPMISTPEDLEQAQAHLRTLQGSGIKSEQMQHRIMLTSIAIQVFQGQQAEFSSPPAVSSTDIEFDKSPFDMKF